MPSIKSLVLPLKSKFSGDDPKDRNRLFEAFAEVENQLNTATSSGLGNDYARAYGSAAQAIVTATLTALIFDKTTAQSGGLHSDTSQNTRFTIFKAGPYLISGHCQWAAHATGVRKIQIQVNGATIIASQEAINLNATILDMSVSAGYYLNVGDYVEIMVYQTSGGNLNVNSAVNYSPEGFVGQL